MQIGLIIRELRESKGLSRPELVEVMQGDISFDGLQNIETLKSNPRFSTIIKLLNALDAELQVIVAFALPGSEPFDVSLE